MQIIKNKKIFFKKNLQIIFGHYTRLRGIAQTVWSCPTLPGSLQWVSGAHQLRSAEQRSAVRLIPTPDTGNRPTAVSGYRRSVLQPTANCQASKARAWHTEGRWPRATPRRRVPSTSSAPLTLMEIRFWKVGQWGRTAVGNICAQAGVTIIQLEGP